MNAFSSCRKVISDVAARTDDSKLFHARVAETGNARSVAGYIKIVIRLSLCFDVVVIVTTVVTTESVLYVVMCSVREATNDSQRKTTRRRRRRTRRRRTTGIVSALWIG